MARIHDVFDPDVIKVLQGEMDLGPSPEPEVKQKPKRKRKTKAPAGHVLFSKLFGFEPTNIPDIPVRVFKDKDWGAEAQCMIPDPDPVWVWNKDLLEALTLAIQCGDTVLLHGMPGTGKSCAAKQYAAVCRIPMWRMSCNEETREQHFLGAPNLKYNEEGQMSIVQEPTVLTDSLRYGGMYVEDEAFRHSAALVLQALREKATRQVVLPDAPGVEASDRVLRAPEGKWWYVLTDNTKGTGDETGMFDAQVQDASTLDRIDVSIEVPYLTVEEEQTMLAKHIPDLDKELAKNLCMFAKEVRKSFAGGHMMTTMSVRGLMAWAEKIQLTDKIAYSLKLVMYNKLTASDRAIVQDLYNQVFGVAFND